jgi:CheY-like chemotaxis protein
MLKVLLVEDNPMIIELLREGVAPLADIVAVSDAADALLRTIEDPPDLIITDYRMPGIDGRQLLEKLRSRASTMKLPVVMMAAKSDITGHLKPLEPDLADFIAKPFFLKDATLRIKRVLDRIALEKMTRDATGGSVVRGSLGQMNVIDLFQSLEMGRKTCSLTLVNGDERSVLYFSDGQIAHATSQNLQGDEAVYHALTYSDAGSFEIDFEGRSAEQTTTRSTQGLLMEGLRLLDESNRDA